MSIIERIFTENFSKLLKENKIVRDVKKGIVEKILVRFSFENEPPYALQTFCLKKLPNGNTKFRSVGYFSDGIALQTIVSKKGEIVEHFIGTRFANGNNPITHNLFIQRRGITSYGADISTLDGGRKLKAVDIDTKNNKSEANALRRLALEDWRKSGLMKI